ncbi:MAG: hypothetical protein EBV53_01245 [Proteobacteria bacterium]|nr:hypothetical protein [Pseudomonadota bacterium]
MGPPTSKVSKINPDAMVTRHAMRDASWTVAVYALYDWTNGAYAERTGPVALAPEDELASTGSSTADIGVDGDASLMVMMTGHTECGTMLAGTSQVPVGTMSPHRQERTGGQKGT